MGGRGGASHIAARVVGATQSLVIANMTIAVTKGAHVFSDGTGRSSRASDEANIYTLPNGVSFYFKSNMKSTDQSMTPELIIKSYAALPGFLQQRTVKTIEVVDYENPRDEYWRRVYKNFSRSYATGGAESVTFYRSRYHDPHSVVTTLAHETGHTIDRTFTQSRNPFSEGSIWNDAMQMDYVSSRLKSISPYGTNSNAEDFAESVAYYVTNHDRFVATMPERAKILDAIFSERRRR